MVFGREQGPRFTSSYNKPLVVEMKVASTIMQRILVETGSSVDIITWDCWKKLTYPSREIVPLVHPILGFGGQEVNPTRMIHLPLRFGNKVKEKNLEVDFVVDVPTAYNIILGRPALHRVKAIYRSLLAPALSLKLMTVALARCKGISEQLTNATLLAFDHW